MSQPFIHERAFCETDQVGEGTRIWPFSHVLSGARIGSHTNIGEHVFIENDVVIGDRCTIKNQISLWDGLTLESDVFLGPNVVFTNDRYPRSFLAFTPDRLEKTKIRQGATIGANATIMCGIEIGPFAFVAAGAVVTKSVPAHGFVVGNPGVIQGEACFCGIPLPGQGANCPRCELPLKDNSLAQVQEKFGARLQH